MEIPVINRFSGLDSGMGSLPNPSLIPQILSSSSGLQTLSQSLDLWKWSAVIIAVVATFSGVINRIKLLFVIFRRQKRIIQEIVDDYDSDGDFSVDDSSSSVSSWSEFEEDDAVSDADEPEASSSRSWDLGNRDFRVRGSDYYSNDFGTKRTLRHRRCRNFNGEDGDGDQFSWADFSGGKSVVKLWDNLRFEFDQCHSNANEISLYDLIKEQKIGSILAGKSQLAPSLTSNVLLSAAADVFGKTSVNLWDTRVGSQIPALIAEWKPMAGKILGVKFAGDQKVYIRDENAGKLTVGDLRNVKSPLENITAADVETWFDADAVMVTAE